MPKKNDSKKWFTVSGQSRFNNKTQAFSKTVFAHNEKHAMALTLALLGSQNNLTRRQIQIEQTKLLKENR